MRKPMEVYLSDLEWTKTHDNMGGVMGNIVFKDNMSYEEYRELLKTTYFTLCDKDYITNLQKENEEIKVENEKLTQLWLNSQEKRRKAIEYLEQPYRDNFDYSKAELLNILQNGSDGK